MKKVGTGASMKELDRYAIEELKIPGIVLMEAAASACARELIARADPKDTVLVLCGAGNNGGDGFAIAWHLKHAGMKVKVFSLEPAHNLKGDAATEYAMLSAWKVPVIHQDQVYVLENMIAKSDWVVDALFGIGLSRNIEGISRQLIQHVNHVHDRGRLKVMSVDMPSGIHPDTGYVCGCAVCADVTVTFSQMKAGLMLYPGRDYAGEVIVADIGIPETAQPAEQMKWFTLGKEDIASRLPVRYNRSHKGSYGRLVISAGSKNMTGAAILSARAAYRVGTGLVDMVIPKTVRPVFQMILPEAIITPYDIIRENVDHGSQVEEADKGTIREAIAISSAVLLGPGWSQVSYVVELMRMILEALPENVALIMDADALNILSQHDELTDLVLAHHGHTVITPHLGEASRLLKKPVSEIAKDPVSAALELTEKYGVCCVLKDAMTLVASPDGRIYFNRTGNHGMATAGSGDVLAGVISGLAAEGLKVFDAATLGVYLHGASGDMAALERGYYGLNASDIVDHLHLETLAGITI